MHPKSHDPGPLACLRAVLLPNCREMCRHSSRALDAPLPWWQRPGLALHLLCCRLCRRYRAQLRWLHRASRVARTEVKPIGRLPEAARVRLKCALHEHARETTEPGQDSSHPPLIPPP